MKDNFNFNEYLKNNPLLKEDRLLQEEEGLFMENIGGTPDASAETLSMKPDAVDKDIEKNKMALRMNRKVQLLAQVLSRMKMHPFTARQLRKALVGSTPERFEAAADMAGFYYNTIQSHPEFGDADYEVLEGGYRDKGAAINYVAGKFNRVGAPNSPELYK